MMQIKGLLLPNLSFLSQGWAKLVRVARFRLVLVVMLTRVVKLSLGLGMTKMVGLSKEPSDIINIGTFLTIFTPSENSENKGCH